jgi:hypothetical protein
MIAECGFFPLRIANYKDNTTSAILQSATVLQSAFRNPQSAMEKLMPTWLKVVLVLLLVGVLGIVALVGVLYYAGKKYGPGIMANVEKGEKDGRGFGEQTDNQGCVDEGVKRYRDAVGFSELMRDSLFVRSCLEASRETPNFCDGVPSAFEFTKTIQWRKAQCEKYDSPGGAQCGNLFQQVQEYCQHRSLRRSGDSDNSSQ